MIKIRDLSVQNELPALANDQQSCVLGGDRDIVTHYIVTVPYPTGAFGYVGFFNPAFVRPTMRPL